jgi:hypothetical protein
VYRDAGLWGDIDVRHLRRSAVLAAVLGAVSCPASAEDVLTIDVATFEAGRFVVAGTAPQGIEVQVRGTDVSDIADPASGAFRIARRIVLPGCTVTVVAGPLSRDVDVANCRMAMLGIEAERPTSLLRPRGGWNSTRSYRTNDVVEWDGRDWRAVIASKGRQPSLAGTESFWEELPAGDDPASTSMDADPVPVESKAMGTADPAVPSLEPGDGADLAGPDAPGGG